MGELIAAAVAGSAGAAAAGGDRDGGGDLLGVLVLLPLGVLILAVAVSLHGGAPT